MIDGPHQIAPLIPGVVQERQPRPVEPSRRVQEESTPRRQPQPQEREAAEALLQQQAQNEQELASAYQPLGRQAQRAIDAYASLQNSNEREYVTRILGVDERA